MRQDEDEGSLFQMKFHFPGKDSIQAIVTDIEESLSGRKLGKMVSLNLNDDEVHVAIKKLGTSTIRFKSGNNGEAVTLDLIDQKIALAHRKFKDEVVEKIVKVIESCGGQQV